MNSSKDNKKEESTMNLFETHSDTVFWNGFAASVPGCGHIRYGTPCQDASAVLTSPRPAAIVCDGRGSARLSHFGAQESVNAFRLQLAVLEPFLVNILDGEEEKQEQWVKFCRIMYRTLMQVKYDLAEKHGESEKEFDCTVAFAIAGTRRIGCFQVGDGSIVLRQNGICKTVFMPEKGEFANQTHFLRAGGETRMDFQCALYPVAENSGIAITSDGPEHLMFRLADMTPGKIFDMFLDDLGKNELTRQDLMDYLTRKEWLDDPRGSDDRSLVVLAQGEKNVESSKEPELSSMSETASGQEKLETPPEVEIKGVPHETIISGTAIPPQKKSGVQNLVAVLLAGLILQSIYVWKQKQIIECQSKTIQKIEKCFDSECQRFKPSRLVEKKQTGAKSVLKKKQIPGKKTVPIRPILPKLPKEEHKNPAQSSQTVSSKAKL